MKEFAQAVELAAAAEATVKDVERHLGWKMTRGPAFGERKLVVEVEMAVVEVV